MFPVWLLAERYFSRRRSHDRLPVWESVFWLDDSAHDVQIVQRRTQKAGAVLGLRSSHETTSSNSRAAHQEDIMPTSDSPRQSCPRGSRHSHLQTRHKKLSCRGELRPDSHKIENRTVASRRSYEYTVGKRDNGDRHDKEGPKADMVVVATLARHLILTPSTFGWWAAYLSETVETIYYPMIRVFTAWGETPWKSLLIPDDQRYVPLSRPA